MATDNIGNDDVFAQLTELFGELLSADLILNVCTTYNWKLTDCIDTLIKQTCSSSSDQDGSPIDDDCDLVIESEEIQTFPATTFSIDSKPFYPTGAIRKTNAAEHQPTAAANTPPKPLMSLLLKHGCNEFGNDRQQHYQKQPRMSMSQLQQSDQMDNILTAIQRGHKIMILMRGPPGCGKTYLSRELIDKTMSCDYANHIFSTDDYFLDNRNRYHYDRSKLTDAHDYNQERVRDRAESGWSPIIVDNTMNKAWELYPYVDIAVRHGYIVEIVQVQTPWSKSAGRLAGKNRHNVGRDKIERMLQTYEPTTVDDLMRSLNLRYQCLMPQFRSYPLTTTDNAVNSKKYDQRGSRQSSKDASSNNDAHVQVEPVWSNGWQQQPASTKCFDDFEENIDKPKPPRTGSDEAFAIAAKQLDKINDEWTAYEKERIDFWTKNDATPVTEPAALETDPNKDMSTVDKETSQQLKLCSMLKSSSNETTDDTSTDVSGTENRLEKHAIGCAYENSAFAQIRQIYPTVSMDILWDLFRHCNGDPDWTMDILLKDETRIDDYKKPKDGADGVRMENFNCECSNKRQTVVSATDDDATVTVAADPPLPVPHPVAKKDKRQSSANAELRKQIEENFVLADQHYSAHSRKIRDIRRGVHTVTVDGPGYMADESGACPTDGTGGQSGATAMGPPDDEQMVADDEFIEIDLGTALVRQLDNAFGIDAFKRKADSYSDVRTNVFMPKELAQQLYALWMESLFNQVEEQRQQSIRDDEDFARQLHAKQSVSELNSKGGTTSNIIDMEYAWQAYKTKIEEWHRISPKDLAARMTHDKLAELFPAANRDSLIQVLAAHDNNFNETVTVLNETLRTNVTDSVEKSERALLDRAKSEVESAPNSLDMLRSASSSSQRSTEVKKLGPEEAKRSALKDFEDCRNSAAHHTQLKAECYTKAREAVQRGETAVALYYSQIANLHKDKIDMYNHKAANLIMAVHNMTQNNPDMLDLHYLHAPEALQSLDIFLDQHIKKLQNSTTVYKYVFVITGRGLHSAGGLATIKIRTKSRLKERNLSWYEVNPGLLKVKVHTTSRFTPQ